METGVAKRLEFTGYLEGLEHPAKSAARSEREDLLDQFLTRLNTARATDGLKPLRPAALSVKLSHIPTSELYGFYKQCDQAKSFSRFFWWAIKPRV